MGRVKANQMHSSTTVPSWTPLESEVAMKDDTYEEQLSVTKPMVDMAMSKMLRIMLGDINRQPIIHSTLRTKALGGTESNLRYVFLSWLQNNS